MYKRNRTNLLHKRFNNKENPNHQKEKQLHQLETPQNQLNINKRKAPAPPDQTTKFHKMSFCFKIDHNHTINTPNLEIPSIRF